ncbi:GNAT family N-acetyltransferase, partial [Planococcus sp. SIMBA_143]
TSDEKVIGTMGYNNLEATNNLEVGYQLIPDYRNKGYAIEMASALVSWAFPDKESNEGKEEMNNVMDRIGLSKLTVEPHLLKNKIDEEKFIKENEYM